MPERQSRIPAIVPVFLLHVTEIHKRRVFRVIPQVRQEGIAQFAVRDQDDVWLSGTDEISEKPGVILTWNEMMEGKHVGCLFGEQREPAVITRHCRGNRRLPSNRVQLRNQVKIELIRATGCEPWCDEQKSGTALPQSI